MSSSIVIGGATFTPDLQTVWQIAQGQQVALDYATADRLKKESPPPKDFKAELQSAHPREADEVSLLSLETRASVFCRLISLANGSTKVRVAVVQYLIDLLNSKIRLRLSSASDTAALQQLADTVSGTGSHDGQNTSPSEATNSSGPSAPGLSQQERSVLQSGQWVTLGVAAITVQSARQLMLGATAVSALTAEALQLQVGIFPP